MPNDAHDELGRFTFSEGNSGTNTGKSDASGSAIQRAASDKGHVLNYLKGRGRGAPIRLNEQFTASVSRPPFNGGQKPMVLPKGTILKAIPGRIAAYESNDKMIGLLSGESNFHRIKDFDVLN